MVPIHPSDGFIGSLGIPGGRPGWAKNVTVEVETHAVFPSLGVIFAGKGTV
jgi:hypothetical protein